MNDLNVGPALSNSVHAMIYNRAIYTKGIYGPVYNHK